MSQYAVETYNISKRYRLIDAAGSEKNLSLKDFFLLPYKRFKEIRSLTSFKNDDCDNIFWALQDINLKIKRGEVLGVVGKNGAGKSTLLKILSKITAPTTGKAILRGRVNCLLEVGTGFNPELTGRENVYMNGTLHGMSKKEIDAKFDEIVDFAGVEKFIDIPTKRYSSGMGLRLGFAVAAYLEPEILIIDEVLAVGDVEFQKKAIGKMQSVSQGEGRTVLFVSHNMNTIAGLCNRAIFLDKGKIVLEGTPSEVISKYLTEVRDKSQSLDLTERTDFLRDGSLRIGKIQINNSDIAIVKNGCDTTFSVEVLNPNKLKGNLEFRGTIKDVGGRVIHCFSSQLKSKMYALNGDNITINFDFLNLPLQAGDYYMHFDIFLNYVWVYEIEEGIKFEVADNDFYKSGKIWKHKDDTMLIDQNWY